MSRMQIPHGNPVLCNSGHSLPTTVATAPVVITILLPYYCADFYFLTGVCVCAYAQSPLTLCDPFSFRGISQVRILEHVAISYSRGSFWPRDWTCLSYISCIGRQILYHCTTWEAPLHGYMIRSCNKHSAKLSSCFFYAPGAHSPNPLPTQQSECLI